MSIFTRLLSIVRIVGLGLSSAILFVATLLIKVITSIAYFLSQIVEFITGAKPKEPLEYHPQRHETRV